MRGHYGPWPGPSLKRVLDKGTLFTEVVAQERLASLANTYPPGYFRALAVGKQKENAPVYAARAAGLKQLTLNDYRRGDGVSVDLTGEYLRRLEPALSSLTPAESGERLLDLAARHDFTFFDFWPTDVSGHRDAFADAVALVERLDAFLGAALKPSGDLTCLLTSDHGNLEDKSIKTHTRNPVPLIVCGSQAPLFADATSLLDVAPLCRKALGL